MFAEPTPHLSIVIPVYNEEGILHAAVVDLVSRLSELHWSYEILLAENGSRDRTVAIAEELARKFPEVKVHSLGTPNYGKALRQGILRARGEFIMCDEIDLCDTDFYQRALDLLEADQADLVVGSKVMSGAEDRRPWVRHAATLVINGMLRVLVDFRGTDTHGLKAFRRDRLVPVAEACVVDRDLFASEFVIRAQRMGRRVVEIPVHIVEKRPPTINLFKRVPKVLRDIARLTYAIRRGA
ncbi:MAG TPA: glycosyltransferase [Polyangia bacterium]|jgi:glycosyltransferase involved in cell wall biosynthesis|nr:glycosyltransferase [Polyangia bacterium]